MQNSHRSYTFADGVVYTAEEIADVTSTHRWWAAWGRERERRRRLSSGWTENDSMAQWLNRALVSQLTRSSVLLDKLAQAPTDVKKISYVIPMSQEMLNDRP